MLRINCTTGGVFEFPNHQKSKFYSVELKDMAPLLNELYFYFQAVVNNECWFPNGGVAAGEMGPEESGNSDHVCGENPRTIGHTGV